MSIEVKVQRYGELSFTAITRGHTVVSDQPIAGGGANIGMTPPELFLASLGTCVGHYVVSYCRVRDIDTEDLEILVGAETEHNPGRLGKITVQVKVPQPMSPEQLVALKRAASHCTIHNTLVGHPEIRIQVHTPTMAVTTP